MPDEGIYRCTVDTVSETLKRNNIKKTALIIVGNVLGDEYLRSLLYDPAFETGFREASK